MRFGFLLLLLCPITLCSLAQSTPSPATVVFWHDGFPTIDSEPLRQTDLLRALGSNLKFLDLSQLRSSSALKDVALLVLPYGSALPKAAWPQIQHFLAAGGNLLLLGGEPFRVPVAGDTSGAFVAEQPQDSYSRALGLRHSYRVPRSTEKLDFAWRTGYSFFPKLAVHAASVFAQEGRLQGLGYLDDAEGTYVAAPIIVEEPGNSRIVALPFHPARGYWQSDDGLRDAIGRRSPVVFRAPA